MAILLLVRTDDAGRRGRGRRSSRRRLRRRGGRSAAVIAGSCGNSCPSAAAGRRGQLMRDVATRRRDWRRLTLAKGRRPPFRWCCLSAVVLAVGCASTTTVAAHPLSGSTTVRPWSQRVAPAVPETHRVHPGSLGRFSDCVATAAAQPPGGGTPAGFVGADDRPSGAELSWLPGREDQRCVVLSTRANEKQAQQLVDDVNTAPVIPTDRPYNCLTTNDAELLLVFRYPTGFESLQVMLTGCAGISAPNRYSRFVTQRLRDDLQGLAPLKVRG